MCNENKRGEKNKYLQRQRRWLVGGKVNGSVVSRE